MKKRYLILILFILGSLFTTNLSAQSAGKYFSLPAGLQANVNYQPNTIIFKLKPEYRAAISISNGRAASTSAALNALFTLYNATKLQQKFPYGAVSPKRSKMNVPGIPHVDLTLIYELCYNSSTNLEDAINQLYATGMFEYVDPKMICQLQSYTPNDPKANDTYQYALSKMHVYEAWDIEKGDTNVVIGMIDTGVNLVGSKNQHEDLKNNFQPNYGEIAANGIDDDCDGYIDNYKGWDLAKDTAAGLNGCGLAQVGGGDRITARTTHGSHTTGCAVAQSDNGLGIAAPAGLTMRYLSVMANDTGANVGSIINGFEGIVYAVDHGAIIINCSWGRQGGGAYQSEQDIINYATQLGCLVLSSAGNWNSTDQDWPSGYKYVLSVGGTDQSDKKYSSSAFGPNVDVCAPGTSIYSSGAGCTNGTLTWGDTCYYTLSGTSEACAYVAGCAAIVKSHFPYYNGLQVGEQLKSTADNIDALNPAYTGMLGTGRVNLFRAVSETPPEVTMPVIVTTDHNDDIFKASDSLFISGKAFNFLDTAHALTVTLRTSSPYVTIIDSVVTVGQLNTLDSATVFQFTALVANSVPTITVPFTLVFTDPSSNYVAYQTFTVNLVLSVGVGEIAAIQQGSLKQNYPNPATGKTIIEFGMSSNANVDLSIYDMTGRIIKNIFTGDLTAGNHSYEVNTENFSNGIYFYTLKAVSPEGSGAETKRMIILDK